MSILKIKDLVHKYVTYGDTEEDKQDLYQETLLQLWRSMVNFNDKCSFSTWMYKVALNVALTFRRKSMGNKHESLEDLVHVMAETENKETEIRPALILNYARLLFVDVLSHHRRRPWAYNRFGGIGFERKAAQDCSYPAGRLWRRIGRIGKMGHSLSCCL